MTTGDPQNELTFSLGGSGESVDLFKLDGSVFATIRRGAVLKLTRAECKTRQLDFPRTHADPYVVVEERNEDGERIFRCPDDERPVKAKTYSIRPVVDVIEN